MAVDLADISRCPVAALCSCCGEPGEAMRVMVATTQVGVFCTSVCGFCAELGAVPWLATIEAVGASLGHCVHLGIDADEMARLIEARRGVRDDQR